MKQLSIALCLVLGLLVSASSHAQGTVRVRGTITAMDGREMTVRSREGESLKLVLTETATVAVAKAIRFEDIKAGDFVGTTTRKNADGTMVAIEVHYLPPTATAGQSSWDLEPETTMTNASVAASVSATGARELVLDMKGVAQKIIVPESAALVRSVPGSIADLKTGEYVFAVVQKTPAGTLSVPRIQVSKDGVKPPQ
jgi:hypothetical protein